MKSAASRPFGQDTAFLVVISNYKETGKKKAILPKATLPSMEIISTIGRLVNRNDIIGAWCFQVLQCAVVQAFKRFGEQCFDKGYSHCHCVITLTQTLCDIPYEVP